MKLEDEALSGVNGGVAIPGSEEQEQFIYRDCPKCNTKRSKFKLGTGGRAVCTNCGYQINDA